MSRATICHEEHEETKVTKSGRDHFALRVFRDLRGLNVFVNFVAIVRVYRGGNEPTYAASEMMSSSVSLATTLFMSAVLAPALVPFCIWINCRAT